MKSFKALAAILCTGALSTAPAFSSVIMDWDASTWSGTVGDSWTDTVGNVVAVKGGGDGPVKTTATINGQSVDAITFSSDSFDVNQTTHPLVGLSSYSISVVFNSTAAGNSTINNFYQWNGIVGKELPGAGVGDWAVGIMGGGLAAGGSALSGGDVGTSSLASVQNTGWHTLSFVVGANGDGTYNQYLYLDGTLQNSNLNLPYGATNAIVASNFAIGARRDGDNGYWDGSIARLQFDNTALSQSQVSTLAATYLGEVPEPASAALALAGLGLLGLRRRRA